MSIEDQLRERRRRQKQKRNHAAARNAIAPSDRLPIPPKRRNPHAPRVRFEIDRLPTHDARILLAHMVRKVGTAEAARRMARTPQQLRRYLKGGNIPAPVHHWLVMAAANTNAPPEFMLERSNWWYPRAKPGQSAAHQRQRLALQALIDEEDAETMALPLDPYA